MDGLLALLIAIFVTCPIFVWILLGEVEVELFVLTGGLCAVLLGFIFHCAGYTDLVTIGQGTLLEPILALLRWEWGACLGLTLMVICLAYRYYRGERFHLAVDHAGQTKLVCGTPIDRSQMNVNLVSTWSPKSRSAAASGAEPAHLSPEQLETARWFLTRLVT